MNQKETLAAIQAVIKIEGNIKEGEYKGYKWRIRRPNITNEASAYKNGFYLCGYVAIPEGHELFQVQYSDIDLDVHGGLSFSGDYIEDDGRQSNYWWIGFDCCHAGDISFVWQLETPGLTNDTYKTMSYVENEICNLIDQIIQK